MDRYLSEQFGDEDWFSNVWIGSTSFDTSDWSGSCSEEGGLCGGAPPFIAHTIVRSVYGTVSTIPL